ncbi:MAG: DUF1858 domain-containing protein [Spirochaetia bacterium]|nr:DUF1858 domain-containing protein [Spirochaetia bacterium]
MAEKTEEKKFTAEMTVKEALNMHPESSMVLAGYHLGGCSSCGVNEIETLEQVCNGYGIPLDALLASLNSLLEEN